MFNELMTQDTSYRQILDGVWRPKIGDKVFLQVDFLMLTRIADGNKWSKKTIQQRH